MDAFTIMKIAGHSGIAISQRCMEPSAEAIERTIEKLSGIGHTIGTRHFEVEKCSEVVENVV